MKKRIIGLATLIAIFITLPLITHAATPSDWAVDEVNKAKSSGLVIDSVTENYQAYITREQFCEMVVRAYEKISDNTTDEGEMSFDDTNNSAILKAANLGIVSGYGNNLFGPNDLITREQIAAMLVRMIDKAVPYEDIDVYDDNYFADEYEISSWALPAVNFAYDNEIMYGVGGDRIDPQDNTTCEQAILLIVRVYDKYNTNIGIIDGDTYYVSDDLYYAEPDEQNIDNEDGIMFVNNELIIHADPDKTDYDDIEDLIYAYDGEIVGEIALTGTYQIRFDDEYSYDELQDIIKNFEKEKFVLWCSTNNVFEMEDDEYYPKAREWDGQWDTIPDGDNWGVEAIKVPFAWDYKNYMSTINVGVYDGYFQDHEDLNSSFRKRYFNIIDYNDDDGHGDHVAGIIGAGFDNKTGIAGVAPTADLYCISKCNLKWNNSMKYMLSLTILIAYDRCKVINFSQSTGGAIEASKGNKKIINNINKNANELSQYLQVLIKLGYKDFLICVAAGNDNNDSKSDIYAVYSNYLNAITASEVRDRIIVVGSCKNNGNNKYIYSSFSNVGERVDVVAPGESILSTVPDNDYKKKSGTSMAAPHVSGLAAMLFSLDGSLTGKEVKEIITSTADIPVQGCKYKMIDAESAIKEVLSKIQYSIVDDNNQKLSDVEILVDGEITHYSDKNGEVDFYLSDGNHTIQLLKDGYETVEIELYDLDYKEDWTYIDRIEMTPIEETETISIPAKHEPISSGDYVESFEYDYNKLLNGDFSDFAGVWKTVSQTNNIEKNLIGTWNYQGFASAWKIGTLTFNSDGSVENSGMRLWYKGTYKVVDEETIKLNFTDNSGYAPPSEDGGGSFQIEPFDIILKYNAEDNSITVPTDAYEYDGYEEGAIYKKENETYINDTQHSIYLRSDGIPEGDESCTVQDITKNPDGSYSWRIISNYGDGYTIILYPTNVNVISWDGKIIQTDTSKPRLWMGNGSVTDTAYNFYYVQSDDNNKTNRQFSYYYNFKHAISFDNFCNYVPYYEKYEDTANSYTVRYDTTDWSDFDIGSYIETYIGAMSSEGYDLEQGEDSVAGEIKYFFRNDYDKSYNQVYLGYNYRFHYLTISIIVDSTKPVG